MSDYQKLKARAQLLQAQREAEVKRELAEKKEKEMAAAKDVEARRKRLEEAAAQLRREELKAANAALTAAPVNGSTATRVEYDPFAEDDIVPAAAGPSQSKLKIGSNGRVSATSMRGAAASGSSVKREPRQSNGNGSASKDRRKEKETTPPLLGRKERAARAFAMQIKKQAKSDSLFSVRNLVETDERGSSPSTTHSRPQPQTQRSNPTSHIPATSKKFSAPGKKGAAAVDELRKLAPGRAGWDRRSIDEIQRDLRAAKMKPEAVSTGMSRTKSAESVNGTRASTTGGIKRPRSTSPSKVAATTPIAKSKVKPPPIPSTARPSHPTPTIGSKRTRSPSTSSSSSSTSSVHRSADRRPRWGEDDLAPADVSATIQGLFRRPGGRPPPARYADSDASSDMEAGMSDVEEEERRAARIARMEDEKAEREERERKERKERLKKEKMRGR